MYIHRLSVPIRKPFFSFEKKKENIVIHSLPSSRLPHRIAPHRIVSTNHEVNPEDTPREYGPKGLAMGFYAYAYGMGWDRKEGSHNQYTLREREGKRRRCQFDALIVYLSFLQVFPGPGKIHCET